MFFPPLLSECVCECEHNFVQQIARNKSVFGAMPFFASACAVFICGAESLSYRLDAATWWASGKQTAEQVRTGRVRVSIVAADIASRCKHCRWFIINILFFCCSLHAARALILLLLASCVPYFNKILRFYYQSVEKQKAEMKCEWGAKNQRKTARAKCEIMLGNGGCVVLADRCCCNKLK